MNMASPPPDLDNQPLEFLIKLMYMTEAEDPIALMAIKKANGHLRKMGTNWEAVLRSKVKIIADPFASINIPPSAMNPNRNQNYTPAPPRRPTPPSPPKPTVVQPPYTARPSRPPPTPRRAQNLAEPGPGNGTEEKRVINKHDGTCIKCQGRVLADHGFAVLWKRSDGKTKWLSEHNGTCPPTRKFKPATTTDDFQV